MLSILNQPILANTEAFLSTPITLAFFSELWSEALKFSDGLIYLSTALIGSILITLKIAMMVFGGDLDADADMDIDASGADGAHGSGFSVFSVFSIISFMMGFGWMGLTCRLQWGLGPGLAATFATGFGTALMFLAAMGMFQMRKMNATPQLDYNAALDQVGTVYRRIPAYGQGRGEVQVTVAGKQMILQASSNGDEIESFKDIRVVEVRPDKSVVVETV